MNAEFENKVILITGSSSGIGKNTAIAFAKLGARVVINGRDEAKIGKTVEECMKASRNKQNVLAVKADLSDSNEIKRLVEETVKKWNRIDVLINCASMNEAGGNIMAENMLEMYEKHFVGKTRAYLQMCHLCAPYVIESEGVIINISGTSGKQPCTIDYMSCLTEAAIDSMTKTLALELGPKGVRVNSV
ncbi:putative oxidoreductase-like protein, partial [Leptotrombidium deliense]